MTNTAYILFIAFIMIPLISIEWFVGKLSNLLLFVSSKFSGKTAKVFLSVAVKFFNLEIAIARKTDRGLQLIEEQLRQPE